MSTVPRLREALLADSGGAIMGAVPVSSTTTSYIESAAGIQVGVRIGLTAVTVAVLFLATLFFAPLATAIPSLRHRASAGVRRVPDDLCAARISAGTMPANTCPP